MNCSLCESPQVQAIFLDPQNGSVFYSCLICDFIFRGSAHYLSEVDEAKRYRFHQNDVNSVGYQNFLMPVIAEVLKAFSSQHVGLDYGSGPSSVVAHLLRQNGYQIVEFDPLFKPEPQLLQNQYDYIVCTEVVEHFKIPRFEFKKLYGLLKPTGKLLIKTGLTDDISDFANWHYQKDPTHVGFFSHKSFQKVAELSGLQITSFSEKLNLVILERPGL